MKIIYLHIYNKRCILTVLFYKIGFERTIHEHITDQQLKTQTEKTFALVILQIFRMVTRAKRLVCRAVLLTASIC